MFTASYRRHSQFMLTNARNKCLFVIGSKVGPNEFCNQEDFMSSNANRQVAAKCTASAACQSTPAGGLAMLSGSIGLLIIFVERAKEILRVFGVSEMLRQSFVRGHEMDWSNARLFRRRR